MKSIRHALAVSLMGLSSCVPLTSTVYQPESVEMTIEQAVCSIPGLYRAVLVRKDVEVQVSAAENAGSVSVWISLSLPDTGRFTFSDALEIQVPDKGSSARVAATSIYTTDPLSPQGKPQFLTPAQLRNGLRGPIKVTMRFDLGGNELPSAFIALGFFVYIDGKAVGVPSVRFLKQRDARVAAVNC